MKQDKYRICKKCKKEIVGIICSIPNKGFVFDDEPGCKPINVCEDCYEEWKKEMKKAKNKTKKK